MIYFYTNPTDRVWADSALKILHFQRQMFLFGFPSLKKEEGKNYSFYRTHLQKDKTEGPLFFCGSSFPAKTGGIIRWESCAIWQPFSIQPENQTVNAAFTASERKDRPSALLTALWAPPDAAGSATIL